MGKLLSLVTLAILCLASGACAGPATAHAAGYQWASGNTAYCADKCTDVTFLYGTYWDGLQVLNIDPGHVARYNDIGNQRMYRGDWHVIDSSHLRLRLYDLEVGSRVCDEKCLFTRTFERATIVLGNRSFVKELM
jgi:hypothetical protein